jgi:hypothetical protein
LTGRISTNGFIPSIPHNSIDRDTLSSNLNPSNPEEVLYRVKHAPLLYEEVYFANEKIEDPNRLPESDLLKAIHTYASDYYASNTTNCGSSDWHSMDETALIALGILLEEAAREMLGDTGDMVFVEGEEVGESNTTSTTVKNGRKRANSSDTDKRGMSGRSRKKRRKSTGVLDDVGEAS